MKTKFALLQKQFRICGMIAACTMAAGISSAQAPKARIQREITGTEQVALKGSLHPLAQVQNDAGRMPADTPLSGITLYFNRSAAQQADLDALLEAQQNPASAQYHQWLTPDQFAARFGMARADLDKVQGWLQQQGFALESVARSRNAIRFSGTVGQVESAFSTQMHYFDVGGNRHFAPATELSLPAAIAPSVATVRNLSNFRPRPQVVVPRGSFTSQFTSGQSGLVFFAPGDIATAYDVKPLYSASINGAGQSIAIAGQSAVDVGDIENFQSAAGLTKKDPTVVLMPGTGTSTVNPFGSTLGDEGESDLDLEWSGAMAPGANIVFVYTGSNTTYGVYDSIQYAVDELIAPIISLSYASCETQLSAADLTSLEGMFSQAAAQGQTVISASGDQGSTACSGVTGLTTAQQQAVTVDYPASSAYVTGMGGTEIIAANSVSTNSTYWIAASGSDVLNSVKQYIPEVAWNDDSTKGLSSTGGGTSALVARPSWQTGVPGIASGSTRLVPDISLYSSPGFPGYLYCTSDKSNWATTQTASCNSGFRDSSTNLLTVAGGTSFATPIFAGMLALINQKAGYVAGQGLINPTLYKLASNSATYASVFHDVTSGNNNCTSGTTFCGSTTTGFSAGAGYDEVTGLGSVDLYNLATAWPTNTGTSAGLVGTTTTVTPASATPNISTNDVFTITVASASGTSVPTGSVVLKIDGGTDCGGLGSAQGCGGTTLAAQSLTANGTLTYTANFTTAGPHQVLAQYQGDATHAKSTGVGSVSIAGPTSGKGTFTLAATNLSVAQGSEGASTITVTPAGGYTGTVDLTFTTSNNTALTNLCYSFTTNLSAGGGSVAVTGAAPVTTQLTLDAKASDCIAAASVPGSGLHPLHVLHSGNTSMNSGSSRNSGSNGAPAGLAFAGLLLAGWMGRSLRKLRKLACVMALAAVGFAVTACGGGGSGTTPATNPPKGTYTVTVSGVDSATSTITANTTFTFTIN